MGQPSPTAWTPGRPNQQLIEQQRVEQANAARERHEHAALLELGAHLRAAFAGVPIPLIAVQTHFSLLEGTASPAAWSTVLAAWLEDSTATSSMLRERRGGNFPAGASAVVRAAALIDQAAETPPAPNSHVAGEPPTLPGSVAHGHSVADESVRRPVNPRDPAVCANPTTVLIHDHPTNTTTDHDHRQRSLGAPAARRPDTPSPWAVLADRDDLLALPNVINAWKRRLVVGATIRLDGIDVVLLAPDESAYRALCRLLTARHAGVTDAQLTSHLPSTDLATLIVLVQNDVTGRRFAARGAQVWWRADVRPAPDDTPFPALALPLITHIADDRAAAGVLAAMRRRGTIDPREHGGTALVDLLRLPQAYRGYEEQLARSADLRTRPWFTPAANTTGHGLHLPPLPPTLTNLDPDRELRRLAEAGIPRRYPSGETPALRARLEHELQVITGKGFAPYLLTVWSIAHKRRTCGRGSAASSVVVYLLGITNVDPIAARLMFERFLAPERIDPPDVDIDFAWDERDGVFSEILRDFGADHVALVATHQHLHGDGALREAARAHGLGDDAITTMSQHLQDLARYGVDRHRIDRSGTGGEPLPEPWPRILAAAAHLAGAPRHLGVHCGGVVITARPLAEIVPVHPAAKQVPDPAAPAALRAMPSIAWEKDGAEDLCLVKIDVLGNRSLAVIRDSIADLRAWGVFPEALLDDDAWSQETQRDPATRELLRTGATMGCFYIESPAMRQLQAKVGAGDFERLVVHSSIIRPAGMDFIRTYIARHHVLHDPTLSDAEREQRIAAERWYPHPVLRNLLSESYGVLSYQEDVMVVAQQLAGFTSADANQLRKALGRNDTAERLAKLVERFVSGCRARGVDDETIALVWRMISSFAGYSFAKAHSASYAVVSFHCAWLKAHHPAVFLARVIANEGGFYQASAYAEEARRLGVALQPPCVVAGGWHTRATDARTIRLGLQRVKGLSHRTADVLITARTTQPFTGVRDLLERSGCDREEAQALLDAGAFDLLLAIHTPEQRAWLVAQALRAGNRGQRTSVPGSPGGVSGPPTRSLARQTSPNSHPAGEPPALPGNVANNPQKRVAFSATQHNTTQPSATQRRGHNVPNTTFSAAGIQTTLTFDHELPRDPVTPQLPAGNPHTRTWRRWRTLGVLPQAHPLTLWHIRSRPTLRARDLTAAMAKQRVRLVGLVITRKDVNAITKDKTNPNHTRVDDMAFVTLEDETGLVETTWFPTAYHRHAVLLERGEPLLITGTVDVDYGVVSLLVESCAVCALPRGTNDN